jgi:pteridine reductase
MNEKVVLITGAARRVGAKIAEFFHKKKYSVILHCRHSQDTANELAQKFNEQRENSAIVISADLHNISSLIVEMKKAIEYFGRLDVLVNNASSFYPTPLGHVTEKAWDDLQASNVKGAFFLSQAAFPYLQLSQGNIVNIIDIHAKKPLREYSAYCIAKAALAMSTLALAKEMAPHVRVNGVSPGAVLWPEGENMLSEAKALSLIEKIPLARHGDPWDIAKAIYFFVENTYITGEILSVDGGRHLR